LILKMSSRDAINVDSICEQKVSFLGTMGNHVTKIQKSGMQKLSKVNLSNFAHFAESSWRNQENEVISLVKDECQTFVYSDEKNTQRII